MKKILVVDDKQQDCYLLESLLGQSGYEVRIAANGVEALAAARNESHPDLVITDVLMPVLDGYGLCRQWKADQSLNRIPLMFYTATYTDLRDETFALELGADGFIVKPRDPLELLQIIEQVLEEARRGHIGIPQPAVTQEVVSLKEYNQELVRRLECNTLELAETNRRLTREIEQRKQLIAELESRNLELEQFTYTVSHDLKSPLVTVTGFLRHVEEDSRSGNLDSLEHDVATIKRACDKMRQLLDDLLELSRVGRIAKPSETVRLNDLVDEVLTMFEEQLSDGQFQVDVDPELPTVFGDRTRLLEVLQNLVENAIKYKADHEPRSISIGTRSVDDETAICFTDDGSGIDPRFVSKIFGLFTKLNPKTEGTGIGLALVKRIVECHGGRVWAESEGIDRGTTICFTLPDPTDPVE